MSLYRAYPTIFSDFALDMKCTVNIKKTNNNIINTHHHHHMILRVI